MHKQMMGVKNHLNKVNVLKATRQIAMYNYKHSDIFDFYWFQSELFHKLNCNYVDYYIEKTHYKLCKKFMGLLVKKANKASFLKQNYIPLESDLFEI